MAFFFSRRRKQHTNAQVGKADAEDTKVENRVSPFLSILRIVRELRLSDHDDGGNDETQREPDVGGVETADAETTATPGDGPQRLDVLAAGPPEFQESKFFNEVMAKAGAIRAPEEEPQKAQRAFQSVSVIFRPNQHQEPLPQDGFPDLDLVLILMPEEQRQQCVHGWLTPRMIFRLTKSASTSAEMCRRAIESFGWSKRKVTDAEVLDSTLLLEYLPSEFWEGSDRLYKSFVTGWWQTLAAARNVLRRGEVPVPAAIIKELSSGLEFQSRMTDCFLNTGGRIDCALDAILKRSEDSHEILGDGSFAEAYDKELKALPFIPLIDDDYELVRTMLAREAGLKSLPCTKALLRYSI